MSAEDYIARENSHKYDAADQGMGMDSDWSSTRKPKEPKKPKTEKSAEKIQAVIKGNEARKEVADIKKQAAIKAIDEEPSSFDAFEKTEGLNVSALRRRRQKEQGVRNPSPSRALGSRATRAKNRNKKDYKTTGNILGGGLSALGAEERRIARRRRGDGRGEGGQDRRDHHHPGLSVRMGNSPFRSGARPSASASPRRRPV